MKFFAAIAFIASVSAVSVTQMGGEDCDPALDVSEKQLNIELDFFSRTFDEKRYRNARIIYDALLAKGEKPRVNIHTW